MKVRSAAGMRRPEEAAFWPFESSGDPCWDMQRWFLSTGN